MRVNVFSLFVVVFLLCSGSLFGQKVEWYEVVVVEEWQKVKFLVTSLDSIGMKCHDRRGDKMYCTEAEEIHDSKLRGLRAAQEMAIDEANISVREVSVESLESNAALKSENYPFLIDYEYDLVSIEKTSSTVIYLKYDFILIDRRNGQIVARSQNHNLEKPFLGLEYLMEELEELSNGTWDGPQKF
ncbi:hypothetical protein KFE98_11795 [bacterium SCSIO 12741]|nr:hypothetical protein KFE98_11795 [bacterium SCSIO 12741]